MNQAAQASTASHSVSHQDATDLSGTSSVKNKSPLVGLQSIVERKLATEDFYLLSPFAERHGTWEMRMAHRSQGTTIARLVSVACEISGHWQKKLPFQIWAGASAPIYSSDPRYESADTVFERQLVASLRISIEDTQEIEDALSAAVATTQQLADKLEMESAAVEAQCEGGTVIEAEEPALERDSLGYEKGLVKIHNNIAANVDLKRKRQALESQREWILSQRTSSEHRRKALVNALEDVEEKLAELGWTIHL